MTSFQSLNLPDYLLQSIDILGFKTPTPIQRQAIPHIAAGRDLAAEAQTGSGKTAAFALPLIQKVSDAALDPGDPHTLVLTPTRELALQVANVFEDLARFAPKTVKVLVAIGGQAIDTQIDALATGVHVVVATPGRLLDLVANQDIELSSVKCLVLDEADRLLDLGFSDEIGRLLDAMPADRQTLLFTATLPKRVLSLSERVLRNPTTVRVDDTLTPTATIQQRALQVDRPRRRLLLQHLIKSEKWPQTLVFVSTKRAADNLANKLRVAQFSAAALHGGLDQPERIDVLDRFLRGEVSVLVATDLAARGIDVPRLSAVINFDLPRSSRDYVHRVGRTGRAGETGVAISFVDHETEAHFRLIEKRTQIRLPREQVEGFELTGEAPKREKGLAPTKGKRKSKKDKLREQAKLQEQAKLKT